LIAAVLDSAEDYVKPLVGIVLVQTHLMIRRQSAIVEVRCAPFDVEDAIGRGA
jgi:hypothetical protein